MGGTAGPDDETDYSPNQRAKRELIVEAALDVIRNKGVAACTTRAVADASPLTKSAVHYYFANIDDLVDLAMQHYSDDVVARVRGAAAEQSTPEAALEAAVRAYVVPGPAAVPAVWQEYYVLTLRRSDLDALKRTVDPVLSVFRELLADAGLSDGAAAGRVTAFLFGTLMLRPAFPLDVNDVVATVRALVTLD